MQAFLPHRTAGGFREWRNLLRHEADGIFGRDKGRSEFWKRRMEYRYCVLYLIWRRAVYVKRH